MGDLICKASRIVEVKYLKESISTRPIINYLGYSFTIDGIDFKIPDGFSEDADEEIVNESSVQSGITYLTNSKLFEKDDTIVVLLVADYGEYNVTDDIAKEVGGDATTINGVDGYLNEDNFFYVFNYAKDGKLVVLSANDKDVIGDFLVA